MYHHTQVGHVTRIATLATLAAVVYAGVQFGLRRVLWLVAAVVVLVAIAFGSMTVEVDHRDLKLWFGPGWVHRTFPLREIVSWRAVRNRWWYGWGIHLTPHGWLYNIAGWDAVELELLNGRHVRVGTDEPERLCAVIGQMKGAA